jgi:hypothetical protein
MKTFNATGAVLGALLIPAVGLAAESILSAESILRNGSFESYRGAGFNSNIGAGLDGWTIGAHGGIDIVFSTGMEPYYWQAADGNVSLSLNYFGPENVSQTMATTLGMTYQLSFSMAAEIYGGPSTRTMDVLWNGVTIGRPSFEYTGQGPTSMGWVQFSYTMLGTGSDTLTFQSTTPGYYGPALDGVALVPVPEPSVISLAGLGGLAYLVHARTKRIKRMG